VPTTTPKILRVALTAAVATLAGACGDDPVQVQVIEEVEFAASLGIDLTMFTELPSGVYVQDVVVGTGEEVVEGSVVTLSYTGRLTDGTVFDTGGFTHTVGSGGLIPGFDQGLHGMLEGGERRVIIPPEQGYGSAPNGSIPGGSILIFDITADAVS